MTIPLACSSVLCGCGCSISRLSLSALQLLLLDRRLGLKSDGRSQHYACASRTTEAPTDRTKTKTYPKLVVIAASVCPKLNNGVDRRRKANKSLAKDGPKPEETVALSIPEIIHRTTATVSQSRRAFNSPTEAWDRFTWSGRGDGCAFGWNPTPRPGWLTQSSTSPPTVQASLH
ncbi:hypothetical protein IWX90DRAFT_221003 [Phyllosticta citrichinensis]|uniref:Secreted protein n=1 Tax=Phyllosticta citrichinensis TaxID=1130410 RepID=A0ABR1XTZ1_9PEZI